MPAKLNSLGTTSDPSPSCFQFPNIVAGGHSDAEPPEAYGGRSHSEADAVLGTSERGAGHPPGLRECSARQSTPPASLRCSG